MLLTILSIIFGLLGFFVLFEGVSTKHVGSVLGGLAYLGGAYLAYNTSNWIYLIIAFIIAWLLRLLGADKGYKE